MLIFPDFPAGVWNLASYRLLHIFYFGNKVTVRSGPQYLLVFTVRSFPSITLDGFNRKIIAKSR